MLSDAERERENLPNEVSITITSSMCVCVCSLVFSNFNDFEFLCNSCLYDEQVITIHSTSFPFGSDVEN